MSESRDRIRVALVRCLIIALGVISPLQAFADDTTPSSLTSNSEWLSLENEFVRVAIKMSAGGAIGWFSEAESEENLINHFDQGRLIQQSFYGIVDGSRWAEKPWRWNPVQGGDYRGKKSTVTDFHAKPNELYVKTLPMHWAAGDSIPEVTFEQWITLDGPLVRIRYRMEYTGDVEHPVHDQEIPAVFLDRRFSELVYYSGEKPFTDDALTRRKPGYPNERYNCPEHWIAYVDENDYGVGVSVPVAEVFTCYRFGDRNQRGACSYFAPLTQFAIVPGTVFEYECALTCGMLSSIRKTLIEFQSSSTDE
ncbi:hypothetical protein KOR42_31630 [Thalassoglobus neptunius]|uniref:Uncharacterized protein n=1 Tax=Thalassoglobus neptunius TaxID=1938619 RepID=A0A5C5WML2_9PLAN|nr:hypothetical protein [Thalassoglobus neptunius]TWT52066.1 hypothetical protein KOR42_31630 [Thalassoglobus neptunius]